MHKYLSASASTLSHATNEELLLVVIIIVPTTACTGLQGIEGAELWRLFVGRLPSAWQERRAVLSANEFESTGRDTKDTSNTTRQRARKAAAGFHRGFCKHTHGDPSPGSATCLPTILVKAQRSERRAWATPVSFPRFVMLLPKEAYKANTLSKVDYEKQLAKLTQPSTVASSAWRSAKLRGGGMAARHTLLSTVPEDSEEEGAGSPRNRSASPIRPQTDDLAVPAAAPAGSPNQHDSGEEYGLL